MERKGGINDKATMEGWIQSRSGGRSKYVGGEGEERKKGAPNGQQQQTVIGGSAVV